MRIELVIMLLVEEYYRRMDPVEYLAFLQSQAIPKKRQRGWAYHLAVKQIKNEMGRFN